jgi:hypothetical protein
MSTYIHSAAGGDAIKVDQNIDDLHAQMRSSTDPFEATTGNGKRKVVINPALITSMIEASAG